MISSFFLQAQALAQTRYLQTRDALNALRRVQRRIATNHPHLAVVVHTLPNGFRDAGGLCCRSIPVGCWSGYIYEPAVSWVDQSRTPKWVLMMTPELYGVALMGYELL